jgi:CTP-dependent riboflavin kinase
MSCQEQIYSLNVKIFKKLVLSNVEELLMLSYNCLTKKVRFKELQQTHQVLFNLNEGNHGAALAYAAKIMGIKSSIVMPNNTTEVDE